MIPRSLLLLCNNHWMSKVSSFFKVNIKLENDLKSCIAVKVAIFAHCSKMSQKLSKKSRNKTLTFFRYFDRHRKLRNLSNFFRGPNTVIEPKIHFEEIFFNVLSELFEQK